MQNSIWPLVVAIAALIVSLLSLAINFRSSHRTQQDALFKLRLEALVRMQAVAIKWQAVVNDLDEHRRAVAEQDMPASKRQIILQALDGWQESFTDSLAHAKGMVRDGTEGFGEMTAERARECLKFAELADKGLAASRDTMKEKLKRLV